jgi:hypothetical protein
VRLGVVWGPNRARPCAPRQAATELQFVRAGRGDHVVAPGQQTFGELVVIGPALVRVPGRATGYQYYVGFPHPGIFQKTARIVRHPGSIRLQGVPHGNAGGLQLRAVALHIVLLCGYRAGGDAPGRVTQEQPALQRGPVGILQIVDAVETHAAQCAPQCELFMQACRDPVE